MFSAPSASIARTTNRKFHTYSDHLIVPTSLQNTAIIHTTVCKIFDVTAHFVQSGKVLRSLKMKREEVGGRIHENMTTQGAEISLLNTLYRFNS